MMLSSLLADLCQVTLHPDVTVTGLALDSRLIKPGDLFLAYSGTSSDGRDFIRQAIQSGAVAVIAEGVNQEVVWQNDIPIISLPALKSKVGEIAAYFYAFPSKNLRMIGVTGTSGKTSCSHFIASAFDQMGVPCGVIGTLGMGLYGQVKSSGLTTPDAVTLQKTLADLLLQGAKTVAMEVSSHSLDQDRVRGIDFDIGVFTNLTRDHLDYHGTFEAYGAAKRRLFDNVKTAVINIDDPFGRSILAGLDSSQSVIAYSSQQRMLGPVPTVFANDIRLDQVGIHANITTPWGNGELHSSLMGQFNISNLLAVLSVLCASDIPLSNVLDCIAHFQPVPGRMQAINELNKPLVIVDYAHKPDALEKVLIALRAHCHGKLYCIFGCGGERDRGKRPMMAKIAEDYADQVIVTDDNPRYENPKQIVADILRGFAHPSKVIVQHDRAKAISDTIQSAVMGDCILVAGKGAETYQQIGDLKLPFCDVEKVKACFS